MIDFANKPTRNQAGVGETRSAGESAPQIREAPVVRPQVSESALHRIRTAVGAPFRRLLGQLDKHQRQEQESLHQRIQNDYVVWAQFYEHMHSQFSELWDFFGFIEHDTTGWFRSSRIINAKDFLGINREGYSFTAAIEQNEVAGAPHPRKWMLVSLSHSDHSQMGIGDERKLGRRTPINGKLTGLDDCDPNILGKSESAASELRYKAENTPLLFQMYSETVGQKAINVPASVLQASSLVDLCKGLFYALNKDVLLDPLDALPATARAKLLR